MGHIGEPHIGRDAARIDELRQYHVVVVAFPAASSGVESCRSFQAIGAIRCRGWRPKRSGVKTSRLGLRMFQDFGIMGGSMHTLRARA